MGREATVTSKRWGFVRVRIRRDRPRSLPGARLIAGVLLGVGCLAVFPGTASGALRASSAAEVVRSYIDALRAGDWQVAESHWVPHAIAAAHRLGISYEGIDAKYDCTSPVVLALDAIRDGSIEVAIGAPGRVEDHVVVPVRLSGGEFGGAGTEFPYHLVAFQETWRLTSLLDVKTRRWPTRTTRYVVLHYSDSSLVNGYALTEMDRFIDSLGRLLGLGADRMHRLEREKIDYYLGTPADCERLAGVAVPGLTDLPSDAIITNTLPHRHEIVHLMINYRLGALPLYTLPWLQEGAAVSFGGRWGKSARVMVQLGGFVVTNELAPLEDLLAFRDFDGGGGNDMSFAASGLLVSCLVARHGVERFLSLYSRLSGDADEIQGWTSKEIKVQISEACGASWETITA
ncbi:MAG: hypothetical protein IIA44_06930, partial [Acidobacteria bacterium]|nr:hypothetical protein [Acidobacteriota bacterium]